MSQYNSQFYSSIGESQFQSVTDQAQLNSIIKNMQGDTVDRPIKFAKPKYTDVQKTYEELDPIKKKTIILPPKQSTKIRTMEPVFQKPIVLDENTGISAIYNNNDLAQDVPLPTTSVINNLIKDSVMQSQTSFNPEILQSQNQYQTKYEEKIRQSEQQKYNKSMAKQSFNQKGSEIPQPEVFEGEGLKYSQNDKKSSIKPSINDVNKQQSIKQSNMKNSNYPQNNNISVNQTNLQSQKFQSNNSAYPSQVHHSNMPQQSIHSSKVSKKSTHPSQIPMKQSNMYNQSTKQSNIPPNQSKIHNSSKQSMTSQNPPMNQSNMYQQSMKQSNVPHQSTHPSQLQMQQSNVPHQSTHPSQLQMQQSNMYNQSSKQSTHSSKVNKSNIDNNNKSSVKPPLPSYHQSQAQSKINNINNEYNNSIKKSGQPPQSIHQTGMQQSNMYNQSTKKSNLPQKSSHSSQFNNNINNTNISNPTALINTGIYETQIIGSNINNSIPGEFTEKSSQMNKSNKQVISTHVSKSSKIKKSEVNNQMNVEPQPGEYNIMNNRSNVDNNNNVSLPPGSQMGNNMGKTGISNNPFNENFNSMKGSGLPTIEQKIKYSSKKGF